MKLERKKMKNEKKKEKKEEIKISDFINLIKLELK